MLPRETRNQSRLKDPKNSGVDKPSLENTQDEPIKKLKTEKNSQSKNVLLHNAHAHESLHLLRSIASENHEFDNIHETMDALQLILEYKYRSRKVVFTKDLFQRFRKFSRTYSNCFKKSQKQRDAFYFCKKKFTDPSQPPTKCYAACVRKLLEFSGSTLL